MDTGFGSPIRLGSGSGEGQNFLHFSWSSDSPLAASLAGTATGASANDPLSFINYAAQTQPGAVSGMQASTEKACGKLPAEQCHKCCDDDPMSWVPGYSWGCNQSCPDSAIGKQLPDNPLDLLPSIQTSINSAIAKLAFVLVALVILYVGLRKLANE